MSKSGLIILLIVSLFAIYCMVGEKGRGVNNYVIRIYVSIYVLILGMLAILRSSSGLIQGFYAGILALVIAILSLFVFKRDYKKCQILNILGIIVGTIATYYSYLN